MSKRLRIGTRDSELALWQARKVQSLLQAGGQDTELMPVKSTGDLVLDKPLYELGITGIFTKTLDVALLRKDIDLAVHSMKDVPTGLPRGIVQAAVLKRANPLDILVHKGLDFLNAEGVVATGSLRRKAQWLHRYPLHEIVDLRGNVNTRLQKLADHGWDAAIFAAAGLERIGLLPDRFSTLQWMLPAPAQGAMMVVAREGDTHALEALSGLNDPETERCTAVEREFLRELEGGCTAPIGALAVEEQGRIRFRGGLFSLDGARKVLVEKETNAEAISGFGRRCAREILDSGGGAILEEVRKTLSR
jgi:hydroxymethylbilane synthase